MEGVRRERRERSVEIEVLGGRERGIVDEPDTVLMKICIVSSCSDALEVRLEVLFERCIVAVMSQRVFVR